MKQIMETKDQEIQKTEESITNIEDAVFEEFCRNIGIHSIRQYEQRDIRSSSLISTRSKFKNSKRSFNLKRQQSFL